MLRTSRASRVGLQPRSTCVLKIGFVAMLATWGGVSSLRAQNTEATVLGTVKDPSGAVVAGAMVRLKNQGTSIERMETTDKNGDYRFSGVEIGSYTLAIEASGFEKEDFSQFDLLARETRRLDITLKIGSPNASRSASRRRRSPISRPTRRTSPKQKRVAN